jgi:hypothetical protein
MPTITNTSIDPQRPHSRASAASALLNRWFINHDLATIQLTLTPAGVQRVQVQAQTESSEQHIWCVIEPLLNDLDQRLVETFGGGGQ